MKAPDRRAQGYLVVLAVVVGTAVLLTFVLGRTYGELALKRQPFDRLSYVPSFDPIEDVTLGLSPNSNNTVVSKPNRAVRAIEVYPTQIILLSGGKAVRTIDSVGTSTLHRLVGLVADPAWISESGPVVTLKAAVVVEHGSSMTIAAPQTAEVVMTVRPGVFLAAWHAEIALSGVSVHASNPAVPTTYSTPDQDAGRPFVLAAAQSSMVIRDSKFQFLGRDWNSSYGVSWSKGSTGSVTGSTFTHDFIGVYTNASNGLRVAHNLFEHNSLYGVDPHSGSTHLLIEYNVSDFNGRHGIIFSDHVTRGVVRFNVTRGNGLNGIMMDEASTGNTISHNTVVANGSDGIVLANSSHNRVADNTVSDNRVGITVRGTTTNATVTDNTVSGNVVAALGTSLAGNRSFGNGGEWSERKIGFVWGGALLVLIVFSGVTWLSNGLHSRRRPLHARSTLRAVATS